MRLQWGWMCGWMQIHVISHNGSRRERISCNAGNICILVESWNTTYILHTDSKSQRRNSWNASGIRVLAAYHTLIKVKGWYHPQHPNSIIIHHHSHLGTPTLGHGWKGSSSNWRSSSIIWASNWGLGSYSSLAHATLDVRRLGSSKRRARVQVQVGVRIRQTRFVHVD